MQRYKMLNGEIREYFSKLATTIQNLNIDEINRAVMVIKEAYERDATIYVFGNGGSAATASHFVCDFNKGISESLEKKFNLICLSDNTPIITAIANDSSYEDIFYAQLLNKLKKEDLIIAISGSGNSGNVIKAVKYAKKIGTEIVGVTGYSGGKLRELADYHMHVAVNDMQLTEDVHMAFDHMMYRVLTDVYKKNDKEKIH